MKSIKNNGWAHADSEFHPHYVDGVLQSVAGVYIHNCVMIEFSLLRQNVVKSHCLFRGFVTVINPNTGDPLKVPPPRKPMEKQSENQKDQDAPANDPPPQMPDEEQPKKKASEGPGPNRTKLESHRPACTQRVHCSPR